jgi:hypothetical protein
VGAAVVVDDRFEGDAELMAIGEASLVVVGQARATRIEGEGWFAVKTDERPAVLLDDGVATPIGPVAPAGQARRLDDGDLVAGLRELGGGHQAGHPRA